MKIAIVGSRAFKDFETTQNVRRAVLDYVSQLSPDVAIISGGAQGVDSFAKYAAELYGLDYEEYPADWGTYGKSAGMIRNAAIVNAADEIMVWWDGKSKGTKNTIDRAHKAGKPVTVITL